MIMKKKIRSNHCFHILVGMLLFFAMACSKTDTKQTGTTVSDIDGNSYNTIVLGSQEWMAENLRTTRYNNSEPIPDDAHWTEVTNTGAFTYQESDLANAAYYGLLYNWHAVNDPRKICPSGWHVPSDDEWTQMTDFVKNKHGYPNLYYVGKILKSCRQEGSPLGGDCNTPVHPRWDSHDTEYGTDDEGFSALPGGLRYPPDALDSNGAFSYMGSAGYWWTSSESTEEHGRYWAVYNHISTPGKLSANKLNGFSVRCVKD